MASGAAAGGGGVDVRAPAGLGMSSALSAPPDGDSSRLLKPGPYTPGASDVLSPMRPTTPSFRAAAGCVEASRYLASGSDVDSPGSVAGSIQVRLLPPEGWNLAPDDTFVSVHVGDQVKHKRLGRVHNFKFQDPGDSLRTFGRVEIFKRIGYTTVSLHASSDFQDIEVPCEDPEFEGFAKEGKINMRFGVKGICVPHLEKKQAADRLLLASTVTSAVSHMGRSKRSSMTSPSSTVGGTPQKVLMSRTVNFPMETPDVDRTSMRRALGISGSPSAPSKVFAATSQSFHGRPSQDRWLASYNRLPSVGTWYSQRSESAPAESRAKGRDKHPETMVEPKPHVPFAEATLQRPSTPPGSTHAQDAAFESTLRPKPKSRRTPVPQHELPWYAKRPETPSHQVAADLTDCARAKAMQLQALKEEYRRLRSEVKLQKSQGVGRAPV